MEFGNIRERRVRVCLTRLVIPTNLHITILEVFACLFIGISYPWQHLEIDHLNCLRRWVMTDHLGKLGKNWFPMSSIVLQYNQSSS